MFVGIGLIIQRLLGLRKFDADHCLMGFWMGLAGIILFLQLWHFKMPVGVLAFFTVSVVGLIGLIWNNRDIFHWLRSNLSGKRLPLIAMLVLTVWLANRSAGPCKADDSGLYHLSGVRWITTHPIVPGLGNLHGRLAFNNASFLYDALLEIGPWYGRASHLANGLLLAVLGAQCILSGYRLAQPNCRKVAVSLFTLMLLTPLVLTAVHSWTSSYTTDLPTGVLAFVGSIAMFNLLLKDKTALLDQSYEVIFILAVLATGVCFKVSLIFFFTFAGLTTIVFWFYRAWNQRSLAIKTFVKAIMMTGFLLVPWAMRGIILSGYPVFPSSFAAMPVPWRVPENLTKWHVEQIQTWAYRSHDITGWQWFGPWLRDLERDIVLPVIITVLAAAVLLWLMSKRRQPRPGTSLMGWLLSLSALMGIAIWFLTAPGRRFGYFLFWILASSFLAMLFHRYAPVENKKLRSIVLIVCLVFSVVNIKKFFILPPPDGGLYATPKVVAKIFTTESGLDLYVPVEGVGCWDMKLPCTPYPRKNLRLRREGDIQSGFILAGPIALPAF